MAPVKFPIHVDGSLNREDEKMLAAIIQAVFGGIGTESLHYRIVLTDGR
jgi:hypothetical protein